MREKRSFELLRGNIFIFIFQANFAFSEVLTTKQKINAKYGPRLLYFHGNNYYMLVEGPPTFSTPLLVAHLLLFYMKKNPLILFLFLFLK
ncbi:hypothetical protein A4U60_13020 [Priestia endophytica]|nr:hypothetical protein A4U60_13020 [Priestia endophytica]